MNSKLALVTGSFDPITLGHVDIVRRAAMMFDRVIVLIANNEEKNYMFSFTERIEIARAAVKDISNVTVDGCDGFVADYAKLHGASAFVRGVRDEKDVLYEQFMANKNYELSGIDTVMLFAKPCYNEISSTVARKLLERGEDAGRIMSADSYSLAKAILKGRM